MNEKESLHHVPSTSFIAHEAVYINKIERLHTGVQLATHLCTLGIRFRFEVYKTNKERTQ